MAKIKALDTSLIAILILAAAGLVLYFHLGQQIQARKQDFSDHISLLGLLDQNGQEAVANSDTKCGIIHYTSVRCHFCSLEDSPWEKLRKTGEQAHCTIKVLVPSIEEEDPANNPYNVVYVPMSFASSFRSRLLPTTVVLGASGEVRWAKVNALTDEDIRIVQKIVQR